MDRYLKSRREALKTTHSDHFADTYRHLLIRDHSKRCTFQPDGPGLGVRELCGYCINRNCGVSKKVCQCSLEHAGTIGVKPSIELGSSAWDIPDGIATSFQYNQIITLSNYALIAER